MMHTLDNKLYEAKHISQEDAIDNVLNKCEERGYTLLEPFKYIGASNTRLKLKCNLGHIWTGTTYDKFVNGNRGCPECGGGLKKTQEYAEEKVLDKCKEKNYTLVEPFEFIGAKYTILNIKCNIPGHGEWKSTYNNFINKDRGCSKCARNLPPTQEEATEIVLNKCKKRNYTLVEPFIYTNQNTKLHLSCNKHTDYDWKPRYVDFIYNNNGCPICKESKGEFKVSMILEKNFNIKPLRQYRFDDLKRFPFDFYLPLYNICIEYDGIQHFQARDKFGGEESYRKTKISDQIKNDYCKKNNIYLFRISYKDNIEEKINELFSDINVIKKIKTFEQFVSNKFNN